MSQEVNPKQIEKLALKKIGGRPHRSYGFDHRILAIEPEEDCAPPDLGQLRRVLPWAHLDEVRIYRRLPVDRRHNAKIDYPLLWRLLEGERGAADK